MRFASLNMCKHSKPATRITAGIIYLITAFVFTAVSTAHTTAQSAESKTVTQQKPSAMEQKETVILAFGDSLTAGYGLQDADSFPSVLQQLLRNKGIPARVVNAGVSGDTSAGGRARISWVLSGISPKPELVILALGANDALQGLSPAMMRENLAAIIETCQSAGAKVLLAGMLASGNMDTEYREAFDAVFPALARQYDTAYYPFLLQDVALQPELNQDDGKHPNPEGAAIIARNLLPAVIDTLTK